MQYIKNLPVITAASAAIIAGLAGYAGNTPNLTVYGNMCVCIVVFYLLGWLAKGTLLQIYEENEKKKNELMNIPGEELLYDGGGLDELDPGGLEGGEGEEGGGSGDPDAAGADDMEGAGAGYVEGADAGYVEAAGEADGEWSESGAYGEQPDAGDGGSGEQQDSGSQEGGAEELDGAYGPEGREEAGVQPE